MIHGPPLAGGTARLWRVFPWDAAAAPGNPYSAASVAPREKQGGGRFDIPDRTAVLYLAETPSHAYAEYLRQFMASELTKAHLRRNSLPLSLVSVDVPLALLEALPDLGDPAVLLRYALRPDVLALPRTHRKATQAVARKLFDEGFGGLCWWSAIHGAWHSTILFTERVPLSTLTFGTPLPATLRQPAVLKGAREAGMIVPP